MATPAPPLQSPSSAGAQFGSIENLQGGVENGLQKGQGRQTSRGSLNQFNANIDDVLDKLKSLNYQMDFCVENQFQPFNRYYFQVADANPNEQLYKFALLVWYLLTKSGSTYPKPGQFDDPNGTCTNIVAELKKLSVPFEFGATKLKSGYGEACIYVLQSLVDLLTVSLLYSQPVHRLDDYPEEAQVDHEAEITTEPTDEDPPANDEEDEHYASRTLVPAVPPPPPVDLAEYRLEVDRVTPLLKLRSTAATAKDWRSHLAVLELHTGKMKAAIPNAVERLGTMCGEVEAGLEKVASRERYINSQFQAQIEMVKGLQDKSSEGKQKYTVASSNVTELTNELARVSEELDVVKSRMDDLGSGMTDSKPLIAIKQATSRIKTEIKQMDLRIGVIENTLLHAKLKGKVTSNGNYGFA